MIVKVISVFVDKETKERYELNKELKISKKRYEEIKEYVEIVNNKNDNNQETED